MDGAAPLDIGVPPAVRMGRGLPVVLQLVAVGTRRALTVAKGMLRFHTPEPGAAPPDGLMAAFPARALVPPAMAVDQVAAAALGRIPYVPGPGLPDKAGKGVEGPTKGSERATKPFRRRIAAEELEARALEAAGAETKGDAEEPG